VELRTSSSRRLTVDLGRLAQALLAYCTGCCLASIEGEDSTGVLAIQSLSWVLLASPLFHRPFPHPLYFSAEILSLRFRTSRHHRHHESQVVQIEVEDMEAKLVP